MHSLRIRTCLVLILLVFAKFAFSQANINSPYSRFGIGDVQPTYFGQTRALGGAATGLREYNSINFFNPASYSAIKLTTLESGLRMNLTQLQSQNDKQFNINAQYGYLGLAFPLTNKWGLSVGLLPYGNMGYSQSLTQKDNILGPENAIYSGEGGLTQGYIGTGYEIIKGLSIGFNAGYVFGNLAQIQSLEFVNSRGTASDTIYNSRISGKTSLGGFLFGYGIQYQFNIGKDSRFTLAYSGNYKTNIITRNRSYTQRYSSSSKDNEIIIDTVSTINNGKSNTVLPTTHNFGIAYHFRDRLLVTTDYKLGKWSEFQYQGIGQHFTNSYQVALGVQYTPDLTSVSSYLALVDYRIGGNFGQTYLNLNGTQINQYAVTLGFGLPIRAGGGYNPSQISSKLNLGFEYGQRGTIASNLVKENYLNIHVGYVLNQLWFYRKRYQ